MSQYIDIDGDAEDMRASGCTTSATPQCIMLSTGVPAKVASERLGHSTVSITLDLYSHVSPGLQEDAAERVAAAVFGS